MRDIGANIRRARARRKLTQDDLAQTVHTTRQTISNYETGRSRPDVETLQRLADALGVELTELLDGAPSAAARRAALRRVCIMGAVTLILAGLWAYLHAVCLRQYQRGGMAPLAAMLITEPLLLCALAWTLLQALHMVTRLRPRRCAPWVHPLVRVLFGLCLAILVASVVLPASGVILPRLYGGRAATAALFFLLGALLWLTQPDTGQYNCTNTTGRSPLLPVFCRFRRKNAMQPCISQTGVVYCSRSKNICPPNAGNFHRI